MEKAYPQHPPCPSVKSDEPDRSRRRLLVALVQAPVLVLGVRFGTTGAKASPTSLGIVDIGDVLALAAALTAFEMVLTITADNRAVLQLPRAEVGQGVTTAAAMILADELDIGLDSVDIELSDARPSLVFNQFTGMSNSVRSLWLPLRKLAANARARLIAAAAAEWRIDGRDLSTRKGRVSSSSGHSASYGSLTAAAAMPGDLVQIVDMRAAEHGKLVGTPTGRIDARELVTGKALYAMDMAVPDAMPTVLARAVAQRLRSVLRRYPGQEHARRPRHRSTARRRGRGCQNIRTGD